MLEKVKKTIDRGVATVSVRSNEFIEITKLKTQNSNLEKEMDFMKQQLGAAYFNQWKTDQIEEFSLGDLCKEIKEKEDLVISNLEKIESLQRQNEQILGSQSQNDGILCNCGKINTSTAKFCISCGNKLEEKFQAPVIEAVDMKSCICGNMVKKTAKFCSKCGNKFVIEEDPTLPEKDESSQALNQ